MGPRRVQKKNAHVLSTNNKNFTTRRTSSSLVDEDGVTEDNSNANINSIASNYSFGMKVIPMIAAVESTSILPEYTRDRLDNDNGDGNGDNKLQSPRDKPQFRLRHLDDIPDHVNYSFLADTRNAGIVPSFRSVRPARVGLLGRNILDHYDEMTKKFNIDKNPEEWALSHFYK